jgi:phosphatidylglycerol lysyltransferase
VSVPRLIRTWLPPIAGLAVFVFALAYLHRELSHLHPRQIADQLRSLPASAVALAAALTVASYLILTLYDVLSVRYVGASLPYRRTALASFLGYAVSQNVGFTLFSGAPLRFRMYTAWGLSAIEVAGVVAFNAASFWLGLLGIGGASLVFAGGASPAELHLPFATLRPLGVIMLLPVVAYLLACGLRRKPVNVGPWSWQLPRPRLALAQLAVGIADWVLAALVLWVLMPAPARGHVIAFVAVFMLAQAAGLISQVPGGLGVFETVVLLSLPDTVGRGAAIGSLIAYRAIYYLLPLAVALLMLAVYEVGAQIEHVGKALRIAGATLRVVTPQLLAVVTFAGGSVLLFFGAVPAMPTRMAWLDELLPLGILELSHFLASIVGVGLLLLGWAVLRRLEAAYYVTSIALAVGIVLTLLRGLQVEAAIALAAMLLALLPARPYFYRHTSLLRQPLSPTWLAAVAVVLVAAAWLGLFAYRHVEYTSELWWQFALHGDASRFLRGGVGVALALAIFGMLRLLGPAPPRSRTPDSQDLDRVRAIVSASPRAVAGLALLGDKRFLFDPEKRAFVMYGIQGRSWVAMGDPVGPSETHGDLIWTFRELADRHGGWTVFYEVSDDNLPIYVDLGLTVLKIGEEGVVSLPRFSLEGGARSGLRHTVNKGHRDGLSFEMLPPHDAAGVLPELRVISDAWLESKNSREKSFSLGRFDESYLSNTPLAVVRRNGTILAFANIWHGAEGGELSIDLMRFLPDAPSGVMDFLFINLMLWGKERGFARFNLGMAPLAGLRAGPLAPLWNRVAAVVFRHGEHFYNFQGLQQYKDKFLPEWYPRYLVCPGGAALPGVLGDLAALISGGLLGALRK